MITEEKAKAYDGALATAKRIISNNCSKVEKLCLECVFPELKESEDERIRKFLLRLAQQCVENSTDFSGDIKKKDVIAYLEKQKEQNLIMAKSPQLKDQEPEGVQGDKGTPGLPGIKAVEGVVHHVANAHYIVTDTMQLNARLREIPEGTEVKILIIEAKEEE